MSNPQALNATNTDLSGERSGAGAGDSVALGTPNMLGDFLLVRGRTSRDSSGRQSGTFSSYALPAANRSFKISDNESPRPQDRLIFSFLYYNNVGGSQNSKLGFPIGQTDVQRYIFGFEKTFFDGNSSVGLRLPVNALQNGGNNTNLGGNSTNIGDLAIVTKTILAQDRATGNLLSAGVVVTVPTGPNGFAGTPDVLNPFNDTTIQPYIGYILNSDGWYMQGFSAVDVPVNNKDVTLFYNDVGFGYYFQSQTPDAVLTGVAPTFEVHLNTPLNHRGLDSGEAGTSDWLVFTQGVTFQIYGRSSIAVGFAEPVTGLKPYDFEAFTHVNVRF